MRLNLDEKRRSNRLISGRRLSGNGSSAVLGHNEPLALTSRFR
jgi:hypothetical protein